MKGYLNLDDLRREAESAARFRGHQLGEWESLGKPFARHAVFQAECKTCGRSVVIDNRPNGIDIGGEAVALGCRD